MNTVYRMYSGVAFFSAAVVLLGSSCSTDWGKEDPIPGVQTLPKLENVVSFGFEEDALDPLLLRARGNQTQLPTIIEDELKGKVLELNDGWVEMNNPLTYYTCEKAASLTFWMKQLPDVVTDEDGNESAGPQDVAAPLFRFSNMNNTQSLTFSANGGIEYDGADGKWSCDNPESVTTGYIPLGGFDGNGWNYVALTVNEEGYSLYVNGQKKVNAKVDEFDCSRLVAFMNHVSEFSIGSADNHGHWLVDDFKMWRNALTAKETARPVMSWESGNSGPGGFDFSIFEYVQETPKYDIGNPDCSTGWWSEFSNYYRIPAATNLRLSFVNHTSGGGNWNNWNLCVCTDADRGADGYAEYFVIRSDLFGWGDAYKGENWTNEGYGDWDAFRADMEGADVTIDIRRAAGEVQVTATAVAPNGKKYIEKFHADCGEGDQIIRAFLIVDGSYLEINGDKCFAYWDTDVTKAMIGASDNSAPWWTEFSDYFTIPSNLSLHLGFYNYTSGGGNWNNWNLCLCTDAERNGDGYAEYFVIRSDLFGWGEAYKGENWTSEGYGNWDQFRLDMDGAYVDLDLVRDAAKVTATAVATSPNSTVYKESIFAECGDGMQPVRAFLIVDGSHLEIEAADCYTYKGVY